MHPVKSSQIESIGFHPETGILAIKFLRGHEYRYQNCTQKDFDDLIASPSPYSLFNSRIKTHPEDYPYTKMPAVQTAGKTNEEPFTTEPE